MVGIGDEEDEIGCVWVSSNTRSSSEGVISCSITRAYASSRYRYSNLAYQKNKAISHHLNISESIVIDLTGNQSFFVGTMNLHNRNKYRCLVHSHQWSLWALHDAGTKSGTFYGSAMIAFSVPLQQDIWYIIVSLDTWNAPMGTYCW